MKKFFKILFRSILAIVLITILSVSSYFFWHRTAKYYSTSLAREVHNLHKYARSTKSSLDLRQVASVDWDELVVWWPYTNICDYEIEDYSEDKNNCDTISDDNGFEIFFLKKNHVVGRAYFDTSITDLSDKNIPRDSRVKKENSIFEFGVDHGQPAYVLKSL